ncbi:hypothetical protein FRAHR75_120149 [Frankia sp. Hr75.2]|nr:hypothetical protein FRAHR75_120149 [Frankia sp. Hr75.2]
MGRVWGARTGPSVLVRVVRQPARALLRCEEAADASGFGTDTGLLRQPGGEGLSPPQESTAPRGAPRRQTTCPRDGAGTAAPHRPAGA